MTLAIRRLTLHLLPQAFDSLRHVSNAGSVICWPWCGLVGRRLLSHATGPFDVVDTLKVAQLVHLFRQHGHLAAVLDPLQRTRHGPWQSDIFTADGMADSAAGSTAFAARSPQSWGDAQLSQLLAVHERQQEADQTAAALAAALGLQGPTDASRQFDLGGLLASGTAEGRRHWMLPQLFSHLRGAYCGTLAVEAAHLTCERQRQWLAERAEQRAPLPQEAAREALQLLARTDALERFLEAKFPSSKRFGIEGCEALLPGLKALAANSAASGVRRIEVGAPHRGRLNLLVTLLGKPPGALFAEMEGAQSEFHVGDVKYHTGQAATLSFDRQHGSGGSDSVRLSIAPNPSHLEAVSPVVLGLVRAQQARQGLDKLDRGRSSVMGLILHGDAAFAGQGMVAETLQLANTPGFSTGGTIHVVINNQVGFTTAPGDARSSPHCTDIAKGLSIPILHANADDPESVIAACVTAAEWRACWQRDVVVDVVGYRRHGHNEQDEPRATLPLSCAAIDTHPRVLELYTRRLAESGSATAAEVAAWQEQAAADFEAAFAAAKAGDFNVSPQQWLGSSWQGDALQAAGETLREGADAIQQQQEPTGLPLATLQWVGHAIAALPQGFDAHPAVQKLADARRSMVEGAGARVDWAMAELLAFGTLMLHRGHGPSAQTPGQQQSAPQQQLQQQAASADGEASAAAGLNYGHYGVRLSGQDSERGTFNQRHSLTFDQATGSRHCALNAIRPGAQDIFEVWNSPLSEAAVLGFEYGHSLGSQGRVLTVWEAQFGDFANNAQVIIDQFLAAGEERWGQQSGLVLMLPHGMEGQGPDHSSCRLERFLQAVQDDADSLPGSDPAHRRQMRATFEALARDHGGQLSQAEAAKLLLASGGSHTERAASLWTEMGLAPHEPVTAAVWEQLMAQWLRRNAEARTNLFVVNATTPAQLFHVLRRQMNRPFAKPLVLATPKWLLHHRRATSALQDFTTGQYFNRVIDDSKASDNTRHLARHPVTGIPFLLPPADIRRVLLVSGAVYYQLSRARQSRRIRDVVLVRLEQIAPFPHDLVARVVAGYPHAEVVWCQEEPKNMGAWSYVKPRLDTALRDKSGFQGRIVRYIGRPAAASPATASLAIHRAETNDLIDAALSSYEVAAGGEM